MIFEDIGLIEEISTQTDLYCNTVYNNCVQIIVVAFLYLSGTLMFCVNFGVTYLDHNGVWTIKKF